MSQNVLIVVEIWNLKKRTDQNFITQNLRHGKEFRRKRNC